jgi:hypothetical protein
MKAEEEWKTAFRTRYELYKYMIMSFELTNAPTTCQEMINDALRQYLDIFVIAYLDDIMIYSITLEKHVQHVSQVLKCLNKRDLRLKPEKCEFHREEVDFLGFVVRRHEIRMDPEKIKAIKEWLTSIDVKDIQAFIEFVQYNRKFIKDFLKRSISLTNLTKKDTS